MKKLLFLVVLVAGFGCSNQAIQDKFKNNFALLVASNPELFDSLIVNDDFSINLRKKIKNGLEDDKYILNDFINCSDGNYFLNKAKTGLVYVHNNEKKNIDTRYYVVFSYKNNGKCEKDTIVFPYFSIKIVWEKVGDLWEYNSISGVEVGIYEK